MRHQLVRWWNDIWSYPQQHIALLPEDPDSYWEKRGTQHSLNPAALSVWQKQRADFVLSVARDLGVHDQALVIADIGSGNGAALRYLERNLQRMQGIGIDGSRVMLEEITRSGFRSLHADVSSKDFSPPEADFTLLFEIAEHVPHAEALIAAALRVSRIGVFVSFPNSGFFTYRARLLFGKFPAQWLYHPSEHLRFWTLRDVRWLSAACGWKDVRIHPYEGVPLLNRLFPALCAAGIVLYIPKHE